MPRALPPAAPSPFPRAALIGAGALLLTSLLAAAAVRWAGVEISVPDAPAVAARSLRFEDRPDGSIAVTDARNGMLVRTIEGEQGFMRGTLRGLARERKRQGIGAQPPFELIARADGRLTLLDPATGRRIDLESFGPDNTVQFARLLAPSPETR